MNFDIQQIFGFFICFVAALTIHEWAHAFVATKLGDFTPSMMGRLTIDPIAHIDLLGTIILPLVGVITQLPLLGWAKPVPVNPRNFKGDRRYAMMLVAFAGPLSNLILCMLMVIVLVLLNTVFREQIDPNSFFYPLVGLIRDFALVNSILAFFNLIPIPPLDGSSVLAAFLPNEVADRYEGWLSQYGFWILLLLMWTGGLFWVNRLAVHWVQVQYSGLFGILG